MNLQHYPSPALTNFSPIYLFFFLSALRLVFVKSDEAKEKLLNCLYENNRPQTKQAPVVAVLAADSAFHEHLPFLFPAYDAKSVFDNNPAWIPVQATLNSQLAAGYFITAARALGLQVGPMTGVMFDKVEETFFAGTTHKPFLVVNLGYSKPEPTVYPRSPRFDFDQAAKIL